MENTLTALTLTAGDTLVVTCDRILSDEQHAILTAHATKRLPDGVMVLILDGGLKVAALAKATPKATPRTIPVIPQPSPAR